MTEPTQSGPYAGQPAPPPQPMASVPGWAPPPQQGASYPYAATPPVGHGRPASPPGDPAAASDRTSGALLILGALLAVGSSFATLDKSVQYLDEGREPVYETVAKAWSYTSGDIGGETESVTQFSGLLLLFGALAAVAAAVLLLTGRSRRLPLGPALAVGGAVLLLGTTLSVLTEAFNDTQWDGDGRTTTFGAGFYLLAVAFLLALGATVTTVLGTRRPATAFPGPGQPSQPSQPSQPWQAAPGGVPGTPGAYGAQAAAQPTPPFPPTQPPAPPTA
ncbi:hypothetical protein [Streptomyces sp. MB09-02B]|uniref:hypothetical protein n=1 Tax=Streptomyces sp. MB09-02B TaxID=3028667 RepID=UPI0029A537E2|nr:hypothetical protein [Streptomyces sp. MB09-02B]MDX3644886.1 hypothetical protein [Streptomyces sp. MB09-02B]